MAHLLSRLEGLLEVWLDHGLRNWSALLLGFALLGDLYFLLLFWLLLGGQVLGSHLELIHELLLLLLFLGFQFLFGLFERGGSLLSVELLLVKFHGWRIALSESEFERRPDKESENDCVIFHSQI